GANGAGKTTLIRLISGLLSPDTGNIIYKEKKHSRLFKDIKTDISYFPQEPSLYADLTCLENLQFFRDLYGLNSKEFNTRSNELLVATDMADFKDRPAGKLSGGMYKKLGLMCVLLNRPKLLLLDEPTVGVDPLSRQELWILINKFAGDDMTVVITTSYMEEALRCSHVIVLDDGNLIVQENPQEIIKKFNLKNFSDIFLRDK
ncbi:MAG: ABC transporter ATP-binding protein, partial [Endomicrobiaceae bacterium]|nr:ABC transporter ATP-binding protein [Endomicrobiaceae bacterium]